MEDLFLNIFRVTSQNWLEKGIISFNEKSCITFKPQQNYITVLVKYDLSQFPRYYIHIGTALMFLKSIMEGFHSSNSAGLCWVVIIFYG